MNASLTYKDTSFSHAYMLRPLITTDINLDVAPTYAHTDTTHAYLLQPLTPPIIPSIDDLHKQLMDRFSRLGDNLIMIHKKQRLKRL